MYKSSRIAVLMILASLGCAIIVAARPVAGDGQAPAIRQIQVQRAALRVEARELCRPHAQLQYADSVVVDSSGSLWSHVAVTRSAKISGWLFSEQMTDAKTILVRRGASTSTGVSTPKGSEVRIADKGLGDKTLKTQFLNLNADVDSTDFTKLDEAEGVQVSFEQILQFLRDGGLHPEKQEAQP